MPDGDRGYGKMGAGKGGVFTEKPLHICGFRQPSSTQWDTSIVLFGLENERNLIGIVMVNILIQMREQGPQRGEAAVLNPHSQYQRAVSRSRRTFPVLVSSPENRAFVRACPLTPFFTNRTCCSSCHLPASRLCSCSVGNDDRTQFRNRPTF